MTKTNPTINKGAGNRGGVERPIIDPPEMANAEIIITNIMIGQKSLQSPIFSQQHLLFQKSLKFSTKTKFYLKGF